MTITVKLLLKGLIPYGLIFLYREKQRLRLLRGPAVVPPPPNTIPEGMMEKYTLNGRVPVLYAFNDDRILDGNIVHNSKAVYQKKFSEFKKGKFVYYDKEGKAVFAALKEYALKNKTVIIWGLAGCNCEALAVWLGANKVYVVDYNKPICEQEKIEVMNHEELSKAAIQGDFAVSYSSFEHDGLGRYGDPLSPDGDLRAMNETWQFLKKDGILFLGVPLGRDCIVWNGCRIYGKNRLPLLLKGWQLLDVFDANVKNTPEYPFDLDLGTYIQNVLVLKKIDKDYPDDEYLTKQFPENTGGTNAKDVLKRINGIIYEHKQKTAPR